MSRFNESSIKAQKTVNLAGGDAYKQCDKMQFVSILLTSFVQDQFYKSANKTISDIDKFIGNCVDKLFAAKAAIYARNEFGMRSITHVTAGELANKVKNEKWMKGFIDKVIYRVDDMTEIVSYYLNKYGKPLPNCLKRGLAKGFDKFDKYQLSKYRAENATVSLVDVVNLVHPKPTKKNEGALKQLVEGKLKSTDTWETKLTQAGQKAENEEQKAELKKESWKQLVESKKIGYFALLRNLRNILQDAPECLDSALAMLVDEKLIKKSLVLPFRYFTAIEEIGKLPALEGRKIIVALNKAAEISLNNVPELPGKTLIALDVSGSMSGRPEQIGRMFSAVLYKANNALLLTFDSTSRFVTLNPTDSLLTLTQNIPFEGGGTNFLSIFENLGQKFDRIIILSDMQGWMTSGSYWSSDPKPAFQAYRKRTGANPYVYSFDLQGYGTLQFPENNVFCIAGFADKVFDIMKLLESDKNALIKEIEKVEI